MAYESVRAPQTREGLESEIADLRTRLAEANETIEAIRAGSVDAFVVEEHRGARVYTLETADRPYRILVESMQQGALTLAPDGTILYCNSAMATLLAVSQEKVTGRSVRDLASEADRAAIDGLVRAGRAVAAHLEASLTRGDGGALPVRLTATRLPLGQDTVLCVLVTDLTERRQYEDLVRTQAALRESEERFRLATEALVGLVYDTDVVAGRVWRSEGLVGLLGLRPEDFPPTTDAWLRRVHPEDLAAVNRELDAAVASRAPLFASEYRVLHKDGHFVWIWDRSRITYDPTGRPTRMLGCTVSIDALKRGESNLKLLNQTLEQRVAERTAEAEARAAQLAKLASELAQAEERVHRRLAEVIHDDLQQTLVAAQMRLGMAQSRTTGEPHHKALRDAAQLLRQAIETSRSLTAELSPTMLYELGLGAALQGLADSTRERHEFTVGLEFDADAEPVSADQRALLFRCGRELLFNAVKHSGVRSARVSLRRTAAGEAELRVEDEGRGFDPAARPDHASGYGLASLRERVALAGGSMEVASKPGSGTRIVVRVPLAPAGGS